MGWMADIGNSLIDTLNNLLKNTGEWTASLLDTGMKAYNNFIDVAYHTVVRDIKDSSFDDFWNIVDYLNNVFSIVASVMLVFLFCWSLFNVSVQNKAEVDIVSVIFDFAKLSVGVFLVAHAIDIVLGIFQFGTKAAAIGVGSINDDFRIINPDQGLSTENTLIFSKGVSGLMGLLISIVAIIGTITMMASAVMIIFEIYKRFFKIFCIIPFASLSLSTFIMADGQGNEIFKGYVKNVIATSFEAIVIVLCLGFSSSLLNSNQDGFVATLFNIKNDLNLREITINNDDDLQQYIDICTLADIVNMYGNEGTLASELVDGVAAGAIPKFQNNKYISLGSFDFHYVDVDWGENETMADLIAATRDYPLSAYVGNNLGLGPAILLILQCVVPMILTAGAVKEAPVFCSKILGM